ncbi:MAG TPA: SDR family NAD(P)-dependent oxidoreductase, partial [Myxococcota bacterium]|nr:SDR family NAD(P)-dependent oxidoreductase [Myxococcota bacterium]
RLRRHADPVERVSGAPRTALVTGASSGIGAATAVELGRRGWHVALGARRLDRLGDVARATEAAGGRALFHALDVSQPDSIEAFYAAATAVLGPIDAVVSNAGMSILNRLQHAKEDDLRAELDVNLLGPMLLARRAIPAMLERRNGDLLFVTSENAVRPRPYQAGYSAAKAGLEALARVLAMELDGTGVRSLVVRIGPTGSEFGARMDHAVLKEALEAWRYWGLQRHLHWMPSESAAKAIVRVLETPVEESYTALVEVMPGGRKKEFNT